MAGNNCLWDATYEASTDEELSSCYAKWADKYDEDTISGMGYVGPVLASKLLDAYLDSKKSKILDAGCGTGLVGKVLKEAGYSNIEATDYCDAMLAQAKDKNVYNNLFQADLTKGLDVPDSTYDAAICVGTFTYAHVGPEAFEEFIRITKPGGYVCFTIRDGAYQEYNYRAKMLELEAEGKWVLQEMLDEDYLVKESVSAKFCNYKVV